MSIKLLGCEEKDLEISYSLLAFLHIASKVVSSVANLESLVLVGFRLIRLFSVLSFFCRRLISGVNRLGCCSEEALKVGVEMFLALVVESLMCNQRVLDLLTHMDQSLD